MIKKVILYGIAAAVIWAGLSVVEQRTPLTSIDIGLIGVLLVVWSDEISHIVIAICEFIAPDFLARLENKN